VGCGGILPSAWRSILHLDSFEYPGGTSTVPGLYKYIAGLKALEQMNAVGIYVFNCGKMFNVLMND
jgi:hypothetical protein